MDEPALEKKDLRIPARKIFPIVSDPAPTKPEIFRQKDRPFTGSEASAQCNHPPVITGVHAHGGKTPDRHSSRPSYPFVS